LVATLLKLEAILIFLWYESFLALITPVDSLVDLKETGVTHFLGLL
jgi:hypothetical protein